MFDSLLFLSMFDSLLKPKRLLQNGFEIIHYKFTTIISPTRAEIRLLVVKNQVTSSPSHHHCRFQNSSSLHKTNLTIVFQNPPSHSLGTVQLMAVSNLLRIGHRLLITHSYIRIHHHILILHRPSSMFLFFNYMLRQSLNQ